MLSVSCCTMKSLAYIPSPGLACLRGKGVDVPDIYQTILEFAGGAFATIENHWIMPDTSPSYNDFKVSVVGSKGMFNMDLTHNQLIERYLEGHCDRPDVLDALSSAAVMWALSTRASATSSIAWRTTSRSRPRSTTACAFPP